MIRSPSPQLWHNGNVAEQFVDYYAVLGVTAECTATELRDGYRVQARSVHPDVSAAPDAEARMGRVNEAWRVLSDPARRADYDRVWTTKRPPPPPQPQPTASGDRRRAWAGFVGSQIHRLASQAGRSAAQTLLVRHPRTDRAHYDRIVDSLVVGIAAEPEARARAARAGGIAPLDLAVGGTLVGIRAVADTVRREASLGITTEVMIRAELLDRMWDVVAHELPVEVANSIGGNPHATRAIRGQ